jgi:hypothetical protein
MRIVLPSFIHKKDLLYMVVFVFICLLCGLAFEVYRSSTQATFQDDIVLSQIQTEALDVKVLDRLKGMQE